MIATHIIEQGCQTSGPGAISAACSPTFCCVFQLIQYIFLGIKELCWSFISYLYLTKTKQNNVPQIFPSFIPNNWIHIHIFHSQ